MNAGQRIKQKREELGWTQEELALKLGYKSRSSVNKVENSRDLSLKLINEYAKVLGCSASFLIGWDDDSREVRHLDAEVAVGDFSLIHKYSQLTQEQQNAVMNMIDLFINSNSTGIN